MELEEFRELALQSLPKLSRGRTVRYTLVRTPGEFFISKIHRQQYLDLRSIPIMKNYRFIQSSLTHGEYATFREDFYDDFDFLRIRGNSFSSLIDIARVMGYGLYGFSSSGNGRIDVKSPGKGNRSEDLINLMKENEEKGMKPFLMTFSKDRSRITIRKDFNYFIHGGYWEAMELIYRTSTAVIGEEMEMLEKLNGLRLKMKLDYNEFVPVSKLSVRIGNNAGKSEIFSKLAKNFTVGEMGTRGDTDSFYAFHKGNERSSYRIDLHGDMMDFLPTLNSKMEGMLEILESVEGEVEE